MQYQVLFLRTESVESGIAIVKYQQIFIREPKKEVMIEKYDLNDTKNFKKFKKVFEYINFFIIIGKKYKKD